APPNPTPRYSTDIHSFTYDNSTNARGTEQTNVAQNSTAEDHLGDVAAFANGHIVTFYNEPDTDFFGNTGETAEFRITDPATGALIRGTEIDGEWDTDAIARDVA